MNNETNNNTMKNFKVVNRVMNSKDFSTSHKMNNGETIILSFNGSILGFKDSLGLSNPTELEKHQDEVIKAVKA